MKRALVRSPPLVFERKNVTFEGKELDVFDIQDAAGVTEAVKVWIKKDDSDLAFSLVSEPYKEICEDLFQKEITDSHFDDPFRSAEGKDLIEYIAGESRLNPYTESFMHILRQDTHFIGTNRMLSALVTNGSQGLIENSLYGDRLHLSLALQEIAVLQDVNKQKNIELDAPPLFKDFQEVKRLVKEYKLSEQIAKNLKYYLAVQQNSREIELMKSVLNNKENEEEVDLLKRTSPFFRTLYNEKESFIIDSGLLLKIRFPLEFESHVITVVLPPEDARRKFLQIHNKAHRQFLYCYSVFCRSFFTIGAINLALDTCQKCVRLNARSSRIIFLVL